MITNKSTRLIPWHIGTDQPRGIKDKSYDVCYMEFDYTFEEEVGTKALYRLVKDGGLIITTPNFAEQISKDYQGKVKYLLQNPNGHFNLLQKIN